MRISRTSVARLAVAWAVAATAVVGVGPVAADAATQPYCGIYWGSLAKQSAGDTHGITTGVRAGRHACFDRLVVDGASWARVRYVDQVRSDGSGQVVPLRGGARLEIVTSSVLDAEGVPAYLPARRSEMVDVTGYRTFRQVAWGGDFEGQLTVGLGVRARLPFRVFVLEVPDREPRVVIDVAHRW